MVSACRGEPPTAAPAASPPTPRPPAAALPATDVDLHLVPGEALERQIKPGDLHVARLEVDADRFLLIEVDSRFVDLEISLRDPRGRSLAEQLSPARRWEPEWIAVVTEVSGVYRLEVRGAVPEKDESLSATLPGTYQLRLAELRAATEADAWRVEAGRLHAAGLAQLEQDTRDGAGVALDSFRAALPAWRRAADLRGEATELHSIALAHAELEEPTAAITSYDQALILWRRLERDDFVAETLYRRGSVRAVLGDYRPALADLTAAFELWSTAEGEGERRGLTLNNRGYVELQSSELQQALDTYRLALEEFRALGLRSQEALALHNLAATHQRLGEMEKAGRYFVEALALAEELADPMSQARALNGIGWGYKAQGSVQLGLAMFEKAISLAEDAGNIRRQGTFRDNLARTLLDLGRPRAALAAAIQALEASRRAEDRRGEAVRLVTLGMIERRLGEIRRAAGTTDSSPHLDRSIVHLDSARRLSDALGDRRNAAAALVEQARTWRSRDALDRARLAAEEGLRIVEAIRLGLDREGTRATYLAFERGAWELHVEILMELERQRPQEGWQEKALAASERARARSLLEILGARGDLRGEVSPELLDRERTLRDRLSGVARRMLASAGDPAEIDEAEMQRLLEALAEVEAEMRRDSRRATMSRPRLLNAAEIQREVLDDESVLVEVALGEERSYLWVVTDESVTVHELPPRYEIEAQARRFQALAADYAGWTGSARRDHRQQFEQQAAALGRSLLAPLSGVPGRRLLVIAEGALLLVPWAALPVPGSGPLLRERELVLLPSASVAAALRQGPRPWPEADLLVVADPVFAATDPRVRTGVAPQSDPTPVTAAQARSHALLLRSARDAGFVGFPRLAGSQREAEMLAALVPESRRRLLIDFAASRTALLSEDLRRYRTIHFATHGLVNPRHPELSGLVLSLVAADGTPRNGFLPLADVSALDISADLVVLSACRTALGKALRGEGLIGLVRGFFDAGGRRVVATLWQVEDRATAALMEAFYRGVFERGLDPSAALRVAQLEFLDGQQDPAWAAPYFWAPFVLSGEWRGW